MNGSEISVCVIYSVISLYITKELFIYIYDEECVLLLGFPISDSSAT